MFADIPTPAMDGKWGGLVDCFKAALQLEKDVNEKLIALHKQADTHSDYQFADFLEGEFLKEQVDAIKELAQHVKTLEHVGPGVGEFQFDKNLLPEPDSQSDSSRPHSPCGETAGKS